MTDEKLQEISDRINRLLNVSTHKLSGTDAALLFNDARILLTELKLVSAENRELREALESDSRESFFADSNKLFVDVEW